MASKTKAATNSKKAAYRRNGNNKKKASQTPIEKKENNKPTTKKVVEEKPMAKKQPIKKTTVTKKEIKKEMPKKVEKVKKQAQPTIQNKEPVVNEPQQPIQKRIIRKKNTFSSAGLVCSTCGFITCGLSSVFGIILSIIGLKKSKSLDGEGKSNAVNGIILGVVSLLIFIGIFLFLYVFSVNTVKETKRKANERNTPVYKMNEDIEISDTYGDYSIKITNVRESSERTNNAKVKADRVIVVSYEYTNINMDQNLFITGARFTAYDKNNVMLQNYPIDYLLPDYIARGRTAQAEIVYALNNDSNEVELEFYKSMFDAKAYCIIKLNW